VIDYSLKGKVALITGAGRGIGASIARAFADSGAAVAVVARTASDVESVSAEIRRTGGRAFPLTVDLNDLETLPALVERTVEEFGGLDTVVSNAGGGDEWRPYFEMDVDGLESSFHFNVSVPFALTQIAVPHMLKRPGASIVTITSVTFGKSMRGHLIYQVAKAGLSELTTSLAAELGPRIRVNSIRPGATETPALRDVLDSRPPELREMMIQRTRLRRNGTPEDIAAAAVYLASPAASWITGAILDVNGGPVDEMSPMFPDL
jgi:7-alpha-hydroxysteroid dehydrogenase